MDPIDFSIIIPLYNEEGTLQGSVDRAEQWLQARSYEYEILLVDNGSTDNTAQVGKRLADERPRVFFRSIFQRGPGLAFGEGVRSARGEWIITLDADLSSELDFITFAYNLRDLSEMVVGSKTFGKQRRTLFRILASQLYILFTQLLFDLTILDYSIGSKAVRRDAVLPVLPHLDPWTGYIFELVLYFQHQQKKVIQIGINCDDTRESRFNLLYEGAYRIRHLMRMKKLLRQKGSWLNGSAPDGQTGTE